MYTLQYAVANTEAMPSGKGSCFSKEPYTSNRPPSSTGGRYTGKEAISNAGFGEHRKPVCFLESRQNESV